MHVHVYCVTIRSLFLRVLTFTIFAVWVKNAKKKNSALTYVLFCVSGLMCMYILKATVVGGEVVTNIYVAANKIFSLGSTKGNF